ncbi:hypothetical protein JCM19237_1936 [Photobacterium aphoticum]|uniref:DUF6985 domain-containing protein n=1 Tax=Photobacterium aphoticum TaxID=754436 RepID=A0A090QTR2_9GAMM|nr:hypothetical protein JCM19237_1936 [Photobacterium aphoticum]
MESDNAGSYISEPVIVTLFGQAFTFELSQYEGDNDRDAFHQAIRHFMALEPSALQQAEAAIFAYYQKINAYFEPDDECYVDIPQASDVWAHIEWGDRITVMRRPYGDKGIYLLLTAWCAWEEDHGLQMVFKHGKAVNMIGPVSGRVSHIDAFGDPSLEEVMYSA